MIRDLPMPASPTSSTPWPSPVLAWPQRSSSSASSWSRPTIGRKRSATPAPRSGCPASCSPSTANGVTGSDRPFSVCARQRRQLERSTHQLPRGLGDHHLARLGHTLQSGRQIGRLADHRLLLCRPLADQLADHHEPGGDADPAGQGRVAGTQPPDRRDNRQPGPNSPLRLVLMRHRPAEIGQDTVAHELRDMTFEPQDLAGHGVLIAAQDRAHLLRVEPSRQRRRAHQIDEHHRELAPLGGGGRWRRFGSPRDVRRLVVVVARERLDRPQQLDAWSQRDTELLQMCLGQLTQRVAIDLVVGEHLDPPLEAVSRQPVADLGQRLHRNSSSSAFASMRSGVSKPSVNQS